MNCGFANTPVLNIADVHLSGLFHTLINSEYNFYGGLGIITSAWSADSINNFQTTPLLSIDNVDTSNLKLAIQGLLLHEVKTTDIYKITNN